jgi:hypothetical protein
MWHDCDSNCDSASGARRKPRRKIEKPRISVAIRDLSTGAIAFFSATVAAMQQFFAHAAAESPDFRATGGPAATQAASPAASFALSA